MDTAIDVTVAALAERDGHFLLVEEEIDGALVLNQPAGHVERGESPLDAVMRETLEESAWRFEPEALLGFYLWRPPQRTRSFLRIAFAGRCTEHDPGRTLDTDVRRALWRSRAGVAAAKLRSPMVLRCIDDYLAGIRYPLSVLTVLPSDDAFAKTLAAGR